MFNFITLVIQLTQLELRFLIALFSCFGKPIDRYVKILSYTFAIKIEVPKTILGSRITLLCIFLEQPESLLGGPPLSVFVCIGITYHIQVGFIKIIGGFDIMHPPVKRLFFVLLDMVPVIQKIGK